MDILFIGGLFPKELETTINEKSKILVQNSANHVQWDLVEGIDSLNDKPVRLLNALFVGSYPNGYQDIFVRRFVWKHSEKSLENDVSVSFFNVFGLKHLCRSLSLAREIKKWAGKTDGSKKVIIVYSLHTPFLFASSIAKQVNRSIHVCLICPDLPEYMNLAEKRGHFYSVLKRYDLVLQKRMMKVVDSFVLFTKHMAERIEIGMRPWIVMEGIANPSDSEVNDIESQSKSMQCESILYCGKLQKAYKVDDLVVAFRHLKKSNLELWLSGRGELEDFIRYQAKQDKRIKYFGQVSRRTVLSQQTKATLLIDPRSSKGVNSRYSFPSKLIEYMLSGTPVLISRLPGIPEEYYDYVETIERPGYEGIVEGIERFLSRPKKERVLMGKKAREFVLRSKNSTYQARRILEMITNQKKEFGQ